MDIQGMSTTVGQLKELLADVPDDAPLLILYDGRCGVSTTIDLIDPAIMRGEIDWAEPNSVYLDIGRGQG